MYLLSFRASTELIMVWVAVTLAMLDMAWNVRKNHGLMMVTLP